MKPFGITDVNTFTQLMETLRLFHTDIARVEERCIDLSRRLERLEELVKEIRS